MSRVTVGGVPDWVPVDRLLGPGDWVRVDGGWSAEVDRAVAADLAARLRGVGLGGGPLVVEVVPPLKRSVVRRGRAAEAMRRRDTSPGFRRRGIHLDEVGRRSLTPEALASELGARVAGATVVDATVGCGGNAIGFARHGCSVVAIDPDPGRLAHARHNAEVYGVADRIQFVAGRGEVVVARLSADLLFVDPPWGPWDPTRTTLADLPVLEPILRAGGDRFGARWAKVPPSFDPQGLPGFDPEAWFGRAAGDHRRVKFVLMRSA